MNESSSGAAKSQRNLLLLTIAYLGFVSLGLPDSVIGVAWPSVRDSFAVSQSGLGLISAGCGLGYFISSFLSGRLTASWGVGLLLALSSGLIAICGFGYAFAPRWLIFLACTLIAGLGSGAIDAGLNRFVASHFSPRHINWLHACYSLGAALGPLLMSWAIVRQGSWRSGYATVGSLMLPMTLLFAVTWRRWEGPAGPTRSEGASGLRASLAHPVVCLQVISFFLYTGLELTVGNWSFTLCTESRGIRANIAGLWVGIYFGSIGVGRVLFGFVAERMGLDRLIRLATTAAVLGAALLSIGSPRWLGFVALALIGLALAPIFPCLMARTPQRLPPDIARHAFGFQVSAAMVGAAAMPGLAGLLVERFGLECLGLFSLVLAACLWATHELLNYKTTL